MAKSAAAGTDWTIPSIHNINLLPAEDDMKKLLLVAVALLVAAIPAAAQFTFTSLDYPGGNLTSTRGINNHGEIVGSYRVPQHGRHALLIRGGQYLPLDPTSLLGTHFSEAHHIKDRGDVVGIYIGDDGFTHGFLLRKGVLTTLDFPAASDTYAFGINESGTVAGFWDILDSSGNPLVSHGFTWNNGNFTQVDFPGAGDTAVLGINARGDLVGEWDTGITATIGHGFVSTKGQFISFDVPFAGATVTQGNDINASGSIVGVYTDASGVIYSFLAEGAKFTNISYPGAAQTTAWGINSAGQIVGNHFDTLSSPPRGFLAQPGNKGKP
jgi:uncharacterized membrane protein